MKFGLHFKTAVLIFSILCTVFWDAVSQAIHFSDVFSSHLVLNPAFTGRFNGNWRAVGIYRQQGEQLTNHYTTGYFSFEYPFYYNNEKIDAGLYFVRDNSAHGTLPVNRLNLSVGHGVRLGLKSMLHAGIQLAGVHKQVTWRSITFPDQYNREIGGFDSSLPSEDMREPSGTFYVDAGLGLLYSFQWNKGISNVGYSIQQVNRPNESFFEISHRLSPKHFFHVKGDFQIAKDLFVVPTFVGIYSYGVLETLVGSHVGVQLHDWLNQQNNVIVGAHVRNFSYVDARSMVYSFGMTWQYWSFMVSYEMDVKLGSAARYDRSALEFGLIYKLPSTDLTRKTIPCERY